MPINDNRVEPNIRQISSFPMPNPDGSMYNSNYNGPMLPNPFQGIPGNPIHQQIYGMTEQEMANSGFSSPFGESNYVSSGGIYSQH